MERVYATDTMHLGQDLRSVAHKKLCETLETWDLMYSVETPSYIPGDKAVSGLNYRVGDLIVFYGDRYVMVEIDGKQHADPGQRRLDEVRDYGVFKHGRFVYRFSCDFILNGGFGPIRWITTGLIPIFGKFFNQWEEQMVEKGLLEPTEDEFAVVKRFLSREIKGRIVERSREWQEKMRSHSDWVKKTYGVDSDW